MDRKAGKNLRPKRKKSTNEVQKTSPENGPGNLTFLTCGTKNLARKTVQEIGPRLLTNSVSQLIP